MGSSGKGLEHSWVFTDAAPTSTEGSADKQLGPSGEWCECKTNEAWGAVHLCQCLGLQRCPLEPLNPQSATALHP